MTNCIEKQKIIKVVDIKINEDASLKDIKNSRLFIRSRVLEKVLGKNFPGDYIPGDFMSDDGEGYLGLKYNPTLDWVVFDHIFDIECKIAASLYAGKNICILKNENMYPLCPSLIQTYDFININDCIEVILGSFDVEEVKKRLKNRYC